MQLKSFTIFVWSSRHFPCFGWFKKFVAFGAFGYARVYCHVVHSISNNFHSDAFLSDQIMEKCGEIGYGEG